MRTQHDHGGHDGKVPPPKGIVGAFVAWLLDDDKRSTRLRSLLTPLCVTIMVVVVIPSALIVLVLYQVWPAVLGGAIGAAGAGLTGWRWLKRRTANATRLTKKS